MNRAVLHRLGLSVGIAIALSGCEPSTGEVVSETAEFSTHWQGEGLWLLLDKRTTCEYLWTTGGGLELRADPRGNVTPNCAASRDYQPLPHERPAQ